MVSAAAALQGSQIVDFVFIGDVDFIQILICFEIAPSVFKMKECLMSPW